MNLLFKHWQQRWRMPELRLLLLALIVSVTVVTAVGFFTSRVENAMQSQARQLLGGDLVLTSARPLDAAYLQRANSLGLETAETISFPSMASSGDKLQLAQLKAVSSALPVAWRVENRGCPGCGRSAIHRATSRPRRNLGRSPFVCGTRRATGRIR